MRRRPAQPPITRALTLTATLLAALTYAWTPGILTPIITAALTYLATIATATWALHLDPAHTLNTTTHHLRAGTTALLRATAHLIQTLAGALLWLLTTAITTTQPATARYTVAA